MTKNRIIISAVVTSVSVTIALTLIISNMGVNETKVESNFANGELELVGQPYFVGDTIQIVGKVNDPNIDFITIEVLDSKKNVMKIDEYGVDKKDGRFQTGFESKKYLTLDEYWNVGTYTARVTAEGLELTKSFEILAPET